MHLEKLDLNLLVALDQLLREQSVTKAALKLCISQPAMSGALVRLREHFGDPLISRYGKGMVLTPFAASLAPQVRTALAMVADLARSRPTFDPATASRRFTVVASDYAQAVFLPIVASQLVVAAPNVSVDAEVRASDHDDRFARGLVDVYIVPQIMAQADHPSQLLFEDEYVLVVWKHNTQVAEQISLAQYLEMGHVIRNNRSSMTGGTGEELRLIELGYTRKVVLRVPSFEMLPRMVVGNQLVAGVQRRLAEQAAGQLPIRILPHPVPIPRLQLLMQWPSFRELDAGGLWLRAMLLKAAQELGTA